MNDPGIVETGLATLAVWRLSHLLWAEDGPFDLVARMRRAAAEVAATRVFDCFYCLSLWLALPVALLLGEGAVSTLLLWLGLSGGACLLQRLTADETATVVEEVHPPLEERS